MNRQCKFGHNCNRIKCKYNHPHLHSHAHNHYYPQNINQTKICNFGKKCFKLPNCKFYHPELHNISKPEEYQQQYYNNNNSNNFVVNYETQSQPDNYTFKYFNERNGSQFGGEDGKQSVKTQQILHYYGNALGNQDKIEGYNGKLIKKDSKSQQFQQSNKFDANFNALNQIHQGQQQYLEGLLQQFFNVRLVKNKKLNVIYEQIYNNLIDLSQVPTLLHQIQLLQQQFNFTYLKLVKTILKYDMDYQKIHSKLQKQQKIDLLKQQSLTAFNQQFPNPIAYNILDQSQLIQKFQHTTIISNPKQTRIFLVDGNNVICAQKRLRKYYHSKDSNIYSQGQFRLRWLVSEIGNCVLFYDYRKIREESMRNIVEKYLYEEEIQQYEKQEWYFAKQIIDKSENEDNEDNGYDEEQNEQEQVQEGEVNENQQQGQNSIKQSENQVSKNAKQNNQQLQQSQISKEQSQVKQLQTVSQHKNLADNLIINWLQKYKQTNANTPKILNTNIILITADKALIQRSLSILDTLMISSGQPFISYCKQYIRRKYFGNKKKKGIIKRIFVEPVDQQ